MHIGAVVGLGYQAGRPEFLEELGPALEERGFESLWVPEHVVLFDEHNSSYPYTADGTPPIPSDIGLLDPFVALSFVAAKTTTLRLGTGVCLINQRNPVYTAKQVADLDVLSRGRVEFGVGIGWLREESEAVRGPWTRRGQRADEHLRVMQALWTQEVSAYDGELYALPECRMYPKPTQRPHPPVHVGGESDAALRRAAVLGQGWFGMNRPPEQVPAVIERIERALADAGRTRADLTVSISPPIGPVVRDTAERYRECGVDRLIVSVIAFERDQLLRVLDDVRAELLPQ